MEIWGSEMYGDVVQPGPFQGMTYLGIDNFEPRFFWGPKILGTVEQDLHICLTDLSRYDRIINVGCAEGHYAALSLKENGDLWVTAFDACTVPSAKMWEGRGVEAR